ncbi:MAG: DUF2752 domain-containing protein [Sandaracinaceae bacterium]|nr:DUF2752 domain-containing protein [Sandaracinaceae bacterium]
MMQGATHTIEARPIYRKLLSPWSTGLATVMLAISFALPAGGTGLGIPMCWLKALTGVPCPGCGLTRSITNISHLHFAEAALYHPFGFPLYLLALVLVVALVWPRARRAFVRLLIRNDVIARRAYWTFVGGFIVFGVGRIAVALVSPETVAHL